MKVREVHFDDEGDVAFVVTAVETPAEYVYATEQEPAQGLRYPVLVSYSDTAAAKLFHRAGKVPGTSEDYEVSEAIYYALLPVVDRLIEYDL